LTETAGSGTYEEKPKINFFLWAGVGFFGVMILAVLEMPNAAAKWLWLGIASLNLAANAIQINNTRNTRYVLWRRGLSIYVGNTREALIRFDKALVFKQFKNTRAARADMLEFEVRRPLRLYPAFAGGRRWLVIFEREDGDRQALVFDPTAHLEREFRQRLIEADQSAEVQESDQDLGVPVPSDGLPATAGAVEETSRGAGVADEQWEEEEAGDEAAEHDAAAAPGDPGVRPPRTHA